jgi:hypothetical protein
MRVSIVCEGSTDFPVLEAVLRAAIPQMKPAAFLVQPDFDALREKRGEAPGPGWQGVRKFLKGPDAAVALGTYDAMIIQVDASIRKEPEVVKESGEEGEAIELEALRALVTGWLVTEESTKAVFVLPREATEAWLLAAHTHLHRVEEIEDPAGSLADRELIAREKGSPQKKQERYRELAKPLPALVGDPRKLRAVPELERFVGDLRSFARSRGGGKGTGSTR